MYCVFKAFETILNMKVLKYLSLFELLSDRHYRDPLVVLTDSWSFFLSRVVKILAVGLYISKAIRSRAQILAF